MCVGADPHATVDQSHRGGLGQGRIEVSDVNPQQQFRTQRIATMPRAVCMLAPLCEVAGEVNSARGRCDIAAEVRSCC